jgi:phosphatidylserine/phosphatidylglycerophosphate/cardiolipin synthase-like enzyme
LAIRLFLSACLAFTALGAAWAEKGTKTEGSQPEIHYAPRENLENLDARAIGRAELSIDMAAYVLSDPRIIEALTDAAERGVLIRLYVDKSQFAEQWGGVAHRFGQFLAVGARQSGQRCHLHYRPSGCRCV